MDRNRPRPGFVAFIAGLLGTGLALLLVVLGRVRPGPAPPAAPTPDPANHPLLWTFGNGRKFYAPLPPPVPRPGGGLLIIAEGVPNGRITLAQALDPAGQVAWSYTTSSTITALITADAGHYFLGAADPDNRIHALDDSGAAQWRFPAGASVLDLAVTDNRPDHLRLGARLLGAQVLLLNGAGQRLWQRTIEGVLAGPLPLDADQVAIGVRPNRVLALQAADGAPAWEQILPGDLTTLTADPGGILAAYDGGLIALDATGHTRWRWTQPGVRLGPTSAGAAGVYALGGGAADPDALTLYQLSPAGALLTRTALSGRRADARLFGPSANGIYVQIARRFYHVAPCGTRTPLTLPSATDLDGFLPLAERTYIVVDDQLHAVAGASWGPACP